MAIDIVTFRLQSKTATGHELSALMGVSPTRIREKGSLISSRPPNGPVRAHTTWEITSAVTDIEELAPHIHAFEPILRRAGVMPRDMDIAVDIVVKVTARPMGWVVYLSSEELEILREAKCGLMMDVYNSDDANESDDEYRFSSELSSDLE